MASLMFFGSVRLTDLNYHVQVPFFDIVLLEEHFINFEDQDLNYHVQVPFFDIVIFTISDDVAKRAKNVKELNKWFLVIDDVVFEQRTFGVVSLQKQNKAILDTYGDSTILKRRREDDDQEGPSARSNRGSKRQKERGEHALASTPSETATEGAGRSTTGSQSRQLSAVTLLLQRNLCRLPIRWRNPHIRCLRQALVEAYEADKAILDTYGESTILKRRREDDDQEGPSAGPNQWSKRQKEGGEQASASTHSEQATKGAGGSTTGTQSRQQSASQSAYAAEPVQTTCQMEETLLSVYETGADDQPIVQTSQHPEWFSQPRKPPLPDHTLTPVLLAGPTYELMRGSCSSLTELEYHLEEVYKATTDQLDWVNPEGQQYPHNLLQPLPLIPDNRGRQVIPFEHFINNDLEYLQGGASSRKNTTSVTKTKAADYWHIKWIEDLVPREMWIQQPIDYNKHALWGVCHWGWKHKQFYGYAVNRESARDIYSKRRIIAVTKLQIMEWHDYKNWIGSQYVVMMTRFINSKKAILNGYASKTLKICCYSWYKESCLT
nr:hypothetical protein [Tanacetum cinerariifolium]